MLQRSNEDKSEEGTTYADYLIATTVTSVID
jgi:hypothetical protein